MSNIDDLLRGAPPSDMEAERGFVGGLLRHSRYLEEMEVPVPVEALYQPRLRLIYATMLDLQEDNEPIDAVTVADRMKETGRLEVAGGDTELLSLIGETLTGALTNHYAGIIVDHWKRRTIAAHCTDAVRDAYRLADPADIQERLESSLAAVESARADSVIFDARDVAEEVIAKLRQMKAEGRHSVGVPTGFDKFDALTGGLVPGELVIIGARPSQGKTAWVVGALEYACQTVPVGLVSIEMGRGELMQRALAGMADVDGTLVRHAALTPDEFKLMERRSRELLKPGRFLIADSPGASMAEVVHICRQLKRRSPSLAVIAVDYMQLIRHEDRRSPRHEQVADISRRLKGLARSMGVCVVALSQLNRKSEDRKDKRPEMADLRESGAVEQDADVIALLHRPEFYKAEDRPGEADMIVCKVRNGPIGEVLLHFDARTTTFKGVGGRMETASSIREKAAIGAAPDF